MAKPFTQELEMLRRQLDMVSTEAQTRADERDYFRTLCSVVCIDFASFQFGLLQLRCHLGKFLVSCVPRESLRLHQLPTIQMTGRGGCFDEEIVRSSYKMLCPLFSTHYYQIHKVSRVSSSQSFTNDFLSVVLQRCHRCQVHVNKSR